MGRERYTAQQRAFYQAYIKSPQWQTRKQARRAKAGNQCEWTVDDFTGPPKRCQRRRYLCVHHNNYERLGQERDGDLDVYCWFHHMLEHLLWKRCWRCNEPCLQDPVFGEKWLEAALEAMRVNLDFGAVNWKLLPDKEVLLKQVAHTCDVCLHQMGR